MKLIILDRDGVINKELKYVAKPEEFEFIDGALEAIAQFHQAGYQIAIATNQSNIERGNFTHEDLTDIHQYMLSKIRQSGGDIHRILYCSSTDNSHPRRKPNPGMLNELLAEFKIPAHESVFIGDYVRDMQAGDAAGCRLIMVRNKHGDGDYLNMDNGLKNKVAYTHSLLGAADIIKAWENT